MKFRYSTHFKFPGNIKYYQRSRQSSLLTGLNQMQAYEQDEESLRTGIAAQFLEDIGKENLKFLPHTNKESIQQDSPRRVEIYYFHPDHLGTATYLSDVNGNPYQFFLNLPFGESMAEQRTGAFENRYKFNAKELDEETGLYYYGARYYNPSISIFISVDPLAETTMQPYSAFNNNPIYYNDPTGMIAEPPGDYYDSKTGEHVFNDGIDDGKVYIRQKYTEAYVDKTRDIYIGQKDQIPDKTKIFNKQLKETNVFFTKKNEEFNRKERGILAGWGGKYKDRLDYFKSQIGYNTDFDIKNLEGSPFKATGAEGKINFKNNYAFYDGKLFRSDDFGNYNYGVAGKAFGFSNIILKAAASYAQIMNPGSPIGGLPSFFDDPKDTYMIGQGINHWDSNFKK
ncbi:MAG: RHS repeat-associated core domain-containing protein [Bacteroidia bacterium]|nr:RHS repeat-associated core domain-containing protein [Bacteroidia bacterium]